MDRDAFLYPLPPGATQSGITIHDWLAAMALQALVTKGMEVQADRAMTETQKDDLVATRAYQLADAMLRARQRVQQATANAAKQSATPGTTGRSATAAKTASPTV